MTVANAALSFTGIMVVYRRDVDYGRRQSDTFARFYNDTAADHRRLKEGTSCIIFSMDRAIQLHALLGSFFAKTSSPMPTYVSYRTTTAEHEKAYQEVMALFKHLPIRFVKQRVGPEFAPHLRKMIADIETDKMFFLVDDILFTEDVDVKDFKGIDAARYIFSLRHGANLSFSYMARSAQPLPEFAPMNDGKISWRWSDGTFDWDYALSIDGHIFLTKEVAAMTDSIAFTSPNTYEAGLQIFDPIFGVRQGLAYKKSRLFNIPCNKVQTDNNNEFGEMHQDDLLAKWRAGEQIDYEALYGFPNIGVHQDVGFNFKKRNA